MSARANNLLVSLLGVAGTALVIALGANSCGNSNAKREAYEAYERTAEALLDQEIPRWTRLIGSYNDQRDPEKADPARYEAQVTNDALPFYEDYAATVTAITVGDPSLNEAHAALLAQAKSRVEFARHLAANFAVFRGTATQVLGVKQNLADKAMQRYVETLDKATPVPDPVFTQIVQLQNDFREQTMVPLSQGKLTSQEVEAAIKSRILPGVRRLRAQKFGDDATSQLLAHVVVAAEEFYAAMLDSLEPIDREARFGGEAARLAREGDDAYKRFQTALDAARRKL